MKNVLLALGLASSLNTSAQINKDDTPPPVVDLRLAGDHLERAGKMRNTGVIVGFTSLALAGMMIAMDSEMAAPAGAMGAVGLVVGVGLNIGGNGHEKKAGRVLQGRQP